MKALQNKVKADSASFKKKQMEITGKQAASSLLQTIDASTPDDGFAKVEAKLKVLQEFASAKNPDDGFAKVEAKLKALQEKIKADTAKFEAEAKAGPSSFVQTFDTPDDGFAKVEAKLKALQEKIKADT